MSNALLGLGDGKGEYYPSYVASTATFGDVTTTAEDTPVRVTLHGGDVSGGVTYYIATLPTKGKLYQVDGAPIESS
eukprot:4271669-Pyramimonas_sp.AAC.1